MLFSYFHKMLRLLKVAIKVIILLNSNGGKLNTYLHPLCQQKLFIDSRKTHIYIYFYVEETTIFYFEKFTLVKDSTSCNLSMRAFSNFTKLFAASFTTLRSSFIFRFLSLNFSGSEHGKLYAILSTTKFCNFCFRRKLLKKVSWRNAYNH